MNEPNIQTLLYIGTTLVGDLNKFAKNRKLSEHLKSEQESAKCDQFTFDVNWKKFKELAAIKFDDDPMSFLRVGKTHVVLVTDGLVRFAGFQAARPARVGLGPEQVLSLTFYEHFARLSGDLVCDPADKNSPYRTFTDRPAHLYVQDLISEFKARAAAAGETINWTAGVVNTLANKTFEYKDFQTISKALCDAMNNVEGAGKFDVVLRTDPADYTHQFVDILKPRGRDKNITIKYPSDGVYTLWSSDYEIEETNVYASEVLVSGNGQVGNPDAGEDTAPLGAATNASFAAEYCYWRAYDSQSNLSSQAAVDAQAAKTLAQRDFGLQVPKIKLVGRPIVWGDADNDDNGLAIGDSFLFQDTNDDGANQSGRLRIIGMETDYDDNGVATVEPALLRVETEE